MKSFLFFLILLGGSVFCGVLNAHAQTKISFGYDFSGNRIDRKVILLANKSVSIAQGDQQKEELEELLGDQEIRIYPNPTKGLLKIDFPSLSETRASLRVHDSKGRLLISKQAQETGNELDLSAYPPGFYILLIQAGTEKREWKIIKE